MIDGGSRFRCAVDDGGIAFVNVKAKPRVHSNGVCNIVNVGRRIRCATDDGGMKTKSRVCSSGVCSTEKTLRALSHDIVIRNTRLLSKRGGKSDFNDAHA